jgi:vancomycin resistance protein YoaR
MEAAMKMKQNVLMFVLLCLTVIICVGCNNEAPPKEQDHTLDGALLNEASTITPNTETVTPTTSFDSEEGKETITENTTPIKPGDVEIDADAILGQYTTYFYNSAKARKNNIVNAAKKLNLKVVNPGEVFSTVGAISPITKENGYEDAGTYQDGRVVNAIGGGVCQVSSTLYNAVLGAELRITERHPHSMTVSYVELGRDAAIAGDYMDFCFQNTLETPIVIEAIVDPSGRLTVRIRGMETRDKNNRKVSYESIILETIEPGPAVVTYDKNQPKNYVKVTQSAHNGYKVELYRLIHYQGELIDRILLSTSTYEASPQYLIIGIK